MKFDADRLVEGKDFGPVKEYHISTLGRYLLNPDPIEVDKTLVGCEVHYPQPGSTGLAGFFRRLFSGKMKKADQGGTLPARVFFSSFSDPGPRLDTGELEKHFETIQGYLRPYDDFFNSLSKLDMSRVTDIVGICEDLGENRSYLTLEGNLSDKLDYLAKYIRKEVKVRLEKVYSQPGLFEMRGADFRHYDYSESFRLMRFLLDGRVRSAVLTPAGQVDFWVDDRTLIHYLQLFEYTIQTNPQLKESLASCAQGRALPLKLLFNQQLDIGYSKNALPRLYREIFKSRKPVRGEKEALLNFFNDEKLSISFHFLPLTDNGDGKPCTDISIMQDFRVLESIKDNLPYLYAELNKRAAISDAGKFYLLDTIRGYKDG